MTATDDTKPTAAHTPGPWHLDGLDNETQLWVRTWSRPIASVRLGRDPDTDRANARRIVAAVNACSGIPTEALEQGVVREMLEALAYSLEFLEANDDGEEDVTRRIAKSRAALAKTSAPRPCFSTASQSDG